MDRTEQLVNAIVEGMKEKKGGGIVTIYIGDLEGAICKYFVICQGGSPAQVEAITDSVEETARKATGEKPSHMVGMENARWVAMDYIDVMAHIFMPEEREFYNLEGLWEDGKAVRISDEA